MTIRTYPALRAVSLLIKISAVLGGIIGAVLVLSLPMFSVKVWLFIAIAFGILFSWAWAELIELFCNMGEDISITTQILLKINRTDPPKIADDMTSQLKVPENASTQPVDKVSSSEGRNCNSCAFYVNRGTVFDKFVCTQHNITDPQKPCEQYKKA